MMYHMLPLVDYEATSAGFCLFNFPQDNQSSLQMLSSNVLPLAEPGPAIILAELGKEWAQATLEVMSAPFLSRQCFVAPSPPSRQYCREMIFLSRVVPVRGDRDYPSLLQHWQNKITRTNLGWVIITQEWMALLDIGPLCLSREVIVLLLLSCCDGINDQDKTIILLPLSYTSHHPKKEKSLLLLKARNNI